MLDGGGLREKVCWLKIVVGRGGLRKVDGRGIEDRSMFGGGGTLGRKEVGLERRGGRLRICRRFQVGKLRRTLGGVVLVVGDRRMRREWRGSSNAVPRRDHARERGDVVEFLGIGWREV